MPAAAQMPRAHRLALAIVICKEDTRRAGRAHAVFGEWRSPAGERSSGAGSRP
jgi:hypothetical protein